MSSSTIAELAASLADKPVLQDDSWVWFLYVVGGVLVLYILVFFLLLRLDAASVWFRWSTLFFLFLFVFSSVVSNGLAERWGNTVTEQDVAAWEQKHEDIMSRLPTEQFALMGDSYTPDGKVMVAFREGEKVYSTVIGVTEWTLDSKRGAYVQASWVPASADYGVHRERDWVERNGQNGFWTNVSLHYPKHKR